MLSAIAVTRGRLSGIAFLRISTAHQPITIAQTVPRIDSRRLSIISWRTSRQRLAPSAARMPISRSRAVARASSRFATFAHAMSSTIPTAPSSINIQDFVLEPTM